MVFSSLAFLVFLPAFLAVDALLRRGDVRVRNAWLLLASAFFYAWWDWRYLGLIGFSTLLDYSVGLGIHSATSEQSRRRWLGLSLLGNLGLLATFKYLGFFVASAATALASVGIEAHLPTLKILLPVGISFYTFQTLSYTIDVYRRRLEPTRDLLTFAVFVTFFPQLVAGPIERASALLPQLTKGAAPSRAMIERGLALCVWGLYKKVAVADQLAPLVDGVFKGTTADPSGLDVGLSLYAFALQIYGDFSGYTDMARGVALLLGIELSLNFNLPYFATNPSDLWRRWHISLSLWLREYLYFSLGGSRGGQWLTARNLLLTMLLGGLWHGAAWNYILWGAFHGGLLVLWHRYEAVHGEVSWSGWRAVAATLGMFHLTVLGWLFFRATSAAQIGQLGGLLLTDLSVTAHTGDMAWSLLSVSWFLVLWQLVQWRTGDLEVALKLPWFAKVAFYAYLLLETSRYLGGASARFLYFQF